MKLRDIIADLVGVIADLVGVAALFGAGYGALIIGHGFGL